MTTPEALAEFEAILGHRFRFERVLGVGRNARVAVAIDPTTGERVVVKVLHAGLGASIEADRFEREMAWLDRLAHPRIGTIRMTGIARGRVYFVMPFVEGPTVRQRLDADGPMPADAVGTVGMELLDLLGHAHGAGVVHRDVEPSNILLTADGAMLIDFGLARAIEVSSGDRVTLAGVVIGTSAYMSPEQCRGDDCTAASDLYSLGCVLFEMLAGRPPFVDEHPIALQLQHLQRPAPDVRTLVPDVPEALAATIARALAKAPEDRWADAAAMQAALAAR
jgi:serine/threonine-protein kinase